MVDEDRGNISMTEFPQKDEKSKRYVYEWVNIHIHKTYTYFVVFNNIFIIYSLCYIKATISA